MKSTLLILSICIFQFHATKETFSKITSVSFQEDIKKSAFHVLVTKCNICHAKKKRQDIFTIENMDSLASDINKQVFFKKKMPKGKKNKLSEPESKALRKWLDLTLHQEKYTN